MATLPFSPKNLSARSTAALLAALVLLGSLATSPPSKSAYHSLFVSLSDNATVARHLHALTSRPHVAGSPANAAAADYVAAAFSSYSLRSRLASYQVLLSYPVRRCLSLARSPGAPPEAFELAQEVYPGDPSSATAGEVIPTFHGYARSGTAAGPVVYANYGRVQDYAALREMGVEVRGATRLDEDGGEQLIHVQPGVAIALADRPPQSPGTLYITTKRVIWLSDADNTKGYAVDFLSISLHAVSRDPEAYALPCIYTQIETEAGGDEESEDSDLECTEELDPSKVTEMRLVPSEPTQLDALFDIFCECAELNPDPHEEQDEENDWIFGDEQMSFDHIGADSEWHFSEELANPIGHANGHDELAHSVLELHINDQRFEDAEEAVQGAHRHPE